MSAKKVFHLNDKVFAKIRGYPAWPAIISGVKADTPSRQRYNVYFYGTGERAECKSDELFPYEENKSKLGKPNKRKYFAEALLQIEDDDEGLVLPDDSLIPPSQNNISQIDQELTKDESGKVKEVEKSNECNVESEEKLTTVEPSSSKGKKSVSSKKSLGISISKGTKRKISDVKPESSPKKSISNKDKPAILESLRLKERPFVLVQALKDSEVEKAIGGYQKLKQISAEKASADATASKIIDKQSKTLDSTEPVLEISDVLSDTIKSEKSMSKTKNSSISEIASTNSENVGQVSRSGRKIKPKKYSDYQNDSEGPKRSRLSKENSKSSEKQNTDNNETDTTTEQNDKTKDTNSETRKLSKNMASATVIHMNDSVSKDFEKINNEIKEDGEMPATIKNLMVSALSDIEIGWKKAGLKKATKIDLLHTEVNLLDYVHKLRVCLRTDHADYEGALDLLDQISELQFTALMLKKHQEIVDTIQKVTMYVGNPLTWNLDEDETIVHEEKSAQIRRKASMVINKCISLFTVAHGQTFIDIYNKEVEVFFTKTKNLAFDQIYGLTTDKN